MNFLIQNRENWFVCEEALRVPENDRPPVQSTVTGLNKCNQENISANSTCQNGDPHVQHGFNMVQILYFAGVDPLLSWTEKCRKSSLLFVWEHPLSLLRKQVQSIVSYS